MVIFAMLIGRALESASAPALARPPFSATRPTDDSQEHINIGRRRIAQWLVVSGQPPPVERGERGKYR